MVVLLTDDEEEEDGSEEVGFAPFHACQVSAPVQVNQSM